MLLMVLPVSENIAAAATTEVDVQWLWTPEKLATPSQAQPSCHPDAVIVSDKPSIHPRATRRIL